MLNNTQNPHYQIAATELTSFRHQCYTAYGIPLVVLGNEATHVGVAGGAITVYNFGTPEFTAQIGILPRSINAVHTLKLSLDDLTDNSGTRNNRQQSFGFNGLDSTVRNPVHCSTLPNLRRHTMDNAELFVDLSKVLLTTGYVPPDNDKANYRSDNFSRLIHPSNLIEGFSAITTLHGYISTGNTSKSFT